MAKRKQRRKYSLNERKRYHDDIMDKVYAKYTIQDGVYNKTDYDKAEKYILIHRLNVLINQTCMKGNI